MKKAEKKTRINDKRETARERENTEWIERTTHICVHTYIVCEGRTKPWTCVEMSFGKIRDDMMIIPRCYLRRYVMTNHQQLARSKPLFTMLCIIEEFHTSHISPHLVVSISIPCERSMSSRFGTKYYCRSAISSDFQKIG